MLVSQYIITHAAQQNLIENRNRNSSNQNIRNNIDFLLHAIEDIYRELEKIKNEN